MLVLDDNGKCIHCKSPRCGAFEHKPNLCVVHIVCLKCMDQGVDKDSICQACGKNELVFDFTPFWYRYSSMGNES
jgi:hypothetical protein